MKYKTSKSILIGTFFSRMALNRDNPQVIPATSNPRIDIGLTRDLEKRCPQRLKVNPRNNQFNPWKTNSIHQCTDTKALFFLNFSSKIQTPYDKKTNPRRPFMIAETICSLEMFRKDEEICEDLDDFLEIIVNKSMTRSTKSKHTINAWLMHEEGCVTEIKSAQELSWLLEQLNPPQNTVQR